MWATDQADSSKTGLNLCECGRWKTREDGPPLRSQAAVRVLGGRGYVVGHYTALAASDSAIP